LSTDKDTLDAAGAQARTYAALATTAPILDQAAQRVGLTSVKSKIASVNASDVTRLIAITARDGDAARAAAIANGLAAVLVQKAATGAVAGRLTVVDPATPPDNPVGPSTGLIVALTAIVGLLGAFGIAALVDSLTNVMRSEDDLARFAPVLGSVNGAPAWRRGRPLVVEDDPDSPEAASYRVLTTKIELSNGEGPLRSLLLVDVHGGRSSARVAANVAAGFAEDGTRVAIIDGDERGRLMGVFTSGAESSDVVQRARPLRIGKLMFDRFRIRRPRLVVLRPRRTSEPIDLEQASETIEHLLAGVDLVLVTGGPPDQSPETLIWARAAQTTVVVAEQDHAKREQMTPTFEGLRVADANVIGAVLS
jgi:Mrp family chromosome partitioning ATPase